MSSSLERLYFRAPVWFQNLMVTGYGLRLRHERYGGRHDADVRRLQATPLGDREAVRRIQRDLLRRTVRHAFAEVPFYRDLARETGVGPDERPYGRSNPLRKAVDGIPGAKVVEPDLKRVDERIVAAPRFCAGPERAPALPAEIPEHADDWFQTAFSWVACS